MYYSSDQIKKNEMGGTCGTCGGEERSIQGSGGENEGKSISGRPTRRWENNIKMDSQEIGCSHGLDLSGSG